MLPASFRRRRVGLTWCKGPPRCSEAACAGGAPTASVLGIEWNNSVAASWITVM